MFICYASCTMTIKSLPTQRLVMAGILLVASLFVGGLLYVYDYHSGKLTQTITAARPVAPVTSPVDPSARTLTAAVEVKKILLFTTNWSSSGVKMHEMLTEFADTHPGVECVQYDATINQQLVTEYGIQSFPSVIIESSDGNVVLFEALTISDFSAYLARLN